MGSIADNYGCSVALLQPNFTKIEGQLEDQPLNPTVIHFSFAAEKSTMDSDGRLHKHSPVGLRNWLDACH